MLLDWENGALTLLLVAIFIYGEGISNHQFPDNPIYSTYLREWISKLQGTGIATREKGLGRKSVYFRRKTNLYYGIRCGYFPKNKNGQKISEKT